MLSEHTVHNMNHPIACLVIHVYDMGHGEDTGEGDLVGEGRHGDSFPRSGDKRCWARWEGSTQESSSSDVSQEHGLQGHSVR